MILSKCENCGAQMEATNAFCPYCGTPNTNKYIARSSETITRYEEDDEYTSRQDRQAYGNGYMGYDNAPQYSNGRKPAYRNQPNGNDGGGINWTVVILVFLCSLLSVFIIVYFYADSVGKKAKTKENVIKEVVVVAPPAPAPPPVVKYVENYFPDGYYVLRGTIYNGKHSADVLLSFDIYGGKVSTGTYCNLKADTNGCDVNLYKKGNTITGYGIDNIGKYFKFNFTAQSEGYYTGVLYFGGTVPMNMRLHREG